MERRKAEDSKHCQAEKHSKESSREANAQEKALSRCSMEGRLKDFGIKTRLRRIKLRLSTQTEDTTRER